MDDEFVSIIKAIIHSRLFGLNIYTLLSYSVCNSVIMLFMIPTRFDMTFYAGVVSIDIPYLPSLFITGSPDAARSIFSTHHVDGLIF